MEPLQQDAPGASAGERAGARAHTPLAHAPAPVPSPCAGAHRLLQRAAACTPAEWEGVTRRARALDAAAHPAAVRRLWHALIGHPQSRALDALNRAACDAASGAAVATPGFTAEQACTYAGRVTAYAVLALALAPELPPADVALLTAPFGPAAAGSGGRADARPAAPPRGD